MINSYNKDLTHSSTLFISSVGSNLATTSPFRSSEPTRQLNNRGFPFGVLNLVRDTFYTFLQ